MAKGKTTAKTQSKATAPKKVAKKAPAKKAPTKKTTTKSEAPKKPSALDAAVTVLAGGKTMTTGEMMEAIMKRRLWATKGKTPAATLASAIIREIAGKGKDARFVKSGPGKFKLRKGA